MKRFVAYLFLVIFSFQVLPVKEIGKILFKGQMTEEVHENDGPESDDGPLSKLKKDPEPIKLVSNQETSIALQHYYNVIIHTAIHEAESLPVHFVPEISTPPPNC